MIQDDRKQEQEDRRDRQMASKKRLCVTTSGMARGGLGGGVMRVAAARRVEGELIGVGLP